MKTVIPTGEPVIPNEESVIPNEESVIPNEVRDLRGGKRSLAALEMTGRGTVRSHER